MKLLLIVLMLMSSTVFAQDTVEPTDESVAKSSDKNFLHVQMLIKDDLKDNFRLINEKSKTLTAEQKMFIFDDRSKSATGPFVLNLLVGFGIGSWVQGDPIGGIIGTGGHGLGLIFMNSGDKSTAQVGAILFLSTYVITLFAPSSHKNSYNKILRKSLNYGVMYSINVMPKLNVAHDNTLIPGVAVSIAL